MPRLYTSLLVKAHSIDPLLPLLLRSCRDLRSASNELRWLRERAIEVSEQRGITVGGVGWRSLLQKYCYERSRGKPLQYVLGTEHFGDVEVLCKPGVLIPRQETAESVTHLVQRMYGEKQIQKHCPPDELRVLDLCTGTGCIPLLFQKLLCNYVRNIGLRALGVDVSPKAVRLAKHNQQRIHLERLNSRYLSADSLSPSQSPKQDSGSRPSNFQDADFVQADVLGTGSSGDFANVPRLMDVLQSRGQTLWDILTSNPPYVSPTAFNRDTSRSVRNFEPKLALVPPMTRGMSDDERGDLFYPRLLDIADEVQAKIVLLEVADLAQAARVAHMARKNHHWDGIEIWRDTPYASPTKAEPQSVDGFEICGQGNGRSVFCWRGDAAKWLDLGDATEQRASD